MTIQHAHDEVDKLAAEFVCKEREVGPAHSNLWDGSFYERFNEIADALEDAGVTFSYRLLFDYFREAVQRNRQAMCNSSSSDIEA